MNIPHEAAPCPSEAARLLPWFAIGRLEPDEAAQVEAHLGSCPACRDDLEWQRTLQHRLRDEPGRPSAPGPAFQKLMARIDETERAMPSPAAAATAVRAPVRVRAPRWLVAAAVVQAVGLGALGTLLWQHSNDALAPQYQTLSSPSPAIAATGPQLRIVFAPGTTLREVAEILTGIDARIVDGPSPAGAYALSLAPRADRGDGMPALLARLRANDRVVFVEPIQRESSP